ncbi:NAD(+) diphosphatase [Schumannella sp. 10F1B-5-1]|uniref:NAD(+) diphosphatase n=1 Tax=Schumannella sp. 10F1B-5-1 TaxID=2590780 RepID=UPI0015E84FFF|nr:NAD(+) diphosphatase [Schumannella sp. 10F1B-5-1]
MTPSFAERLTLARAELDRDHLTRATPIDELLATPGARTVLLHDGQALVDGAALVLLPPASTAATTAAQGGFALYLGRTLAGAPDADLDAPVIALVVTDDDAAERALASARESGRDLAWGDLRRLGAEMSTRDAGIFTEALALANWHRSYGFAPASGRATELRQGGWVRVDADTGKEFFPRTDAAIIVGVIDADDRLLLGSNALWPADRFSLLAGFVEPGESLEAAVQREVFEESGVRVVEPRYLGSQPWPFPASLMVGFLARVADGASVETRPDGEEILDLRWFTRAELAAAVADATLRLPGRSSIARAIIEEWYGGDLGDDSW